MTKARARLMPHSHNWVAWGYDIDSLERPLRDNVHAYCRTVDHRWCASCHSSVCKCAKIFRADEWLSSERFGIHDTDPTYA